MSDANETRRCTHTGLQVSVGKLVFVHEYQALQNLSSNYASLGFRKGSPEMMLQVSQRNILHGDKDCALVLKPPEGLDKAILVLLVL